MAASGDRLRGKVVVIAGASAGIGAAVAHRMAAEGARLVLAARGRERLEGLVSQLTGAGAEAIGVPTDIGRDADCAALIERAVSAFGGLDILINNAALHHRGPVESIAPEHLADMVSVNLRAPILLTRLALPHLRARGGGAVVQVASLAGCLPAPGSATYSATKFGLRIFARALDEELRGSGIRIKVVSPGPVETGFILDDLEHVTDLTLSQPMSTADEIAAAVVEAALDDRFERKMPAMSGMLATLGYLSPGLGRTLRPMLERRGRKVREAIMAKAAQVEGKAK